MPALRRKVTLFLVLAAWVLVPAGIRAQELPERQARPLLRATGQASVAVSPDLAQLDVGVVTEAPNAEAAASQNAQATSAVLAAIRRILGAQAEVKTAGYLVNPIYRPPKEGVPAAIAAYSVANTVRVKTGEFGKLGAVLDAATQAGANRIQGIQFTLKDDQEAGREALRQAALKAKAKAETLAAALGVRIVRLILAEESGPPIRPLVMGERLAMGPMAATPVESGPIEVNATVSLSVEISQ